MKWMVVIFIVFNLWSSSAVGAERKFKSLAPFLPLEMDVEVSAASENSLKIEVILRNPYDVTITGFESSLWRVGVAGGVFDESEPGDVDFRYYEIFRPLTDLPENSMLKHASEFYIFEPGDEGRYEVLAKRDDGKLPSDQELEWVEDFLHLGVEGNTEIRIFIIKLKEGAGDFDEVINLYRFSVSDVLREGNVAPTSCN